MLRICVSNGYSRRSTSVVNLPVTENSLNVGLSAIGDGELQLELRFVGRNYLPLRWWNATVLRKDQWRWQDGRWWVVPGKI